MQGPITIRVQGVPIPKGRPQFVKRGQFMVAITPKRTEDYETRARYCITAAMARNGWSKLEGPVSVEIECAMPIPESWSRRDKAAAAAGEIMPRGRGGDVDNLAKSLCDAANGHLWIDDAQIVELIARKRYGEPEAVMTVRTWSPAASSEAAA